MLADIFETARHLIETAKIVIKQIPQFYLIVQHLKTPVAARATGRL